MKPTKDRPRNGHDAPTPTSPGVLAWDKESEIWLWVPVPGAPEWHPPKFHRRVSTK